VIEGKIEGTGGRRRRQQLLYDLKEKRRYWKSKEEALDRTLWRTCFGGGYGPVVRLRGGGGGGGGGGVVVAVRRGRG
jgi:hypothetical protein